MKKKLYSIFVILIIIIIIINIFDHSSTINTTIAFSIELFIKNIFPSLFPMFLISTMLIEIGIPKFLGHTFKKIMNKLFNSKGEGSFVFFMSMISGFPSSAKYINDLINQNLINDKDGNKILLFTFFSNPLFIVNTVGIMFLENKRLGFLILIAHILGNIFIGLIFRNYNKKTIINDNINLKDDLKNLSKNINEANLFHTILKGIKESIRTLIIVFGVITFFLILINILTESTNFSPLTNSIITGIIEMTSGLKSVALLDINIKSKALLSMFFISFGGLSVHTQIINILNEKKIKYLPFLFSRILHALISVIILFILF